MPKSGIAFLAITVSLAAATADPKDPTGHYDAQITAQIQLIRTEAKLVSRSVMAERLELTPAEAAAFWPIYDAYEAAGAKLDNVRLGCIRTYRDKYEKMTPEIAQDIADRLFDFHKDRIKLAETYFRKVAKAVSTQKAARFLQLDTSLRCINDLKVQAQIPLFK